MPKFNNIPKGTKISPKFGPSLETGFGFHTVDSHGSFPIPPQQKKPNWKRWVIIIAVLGLMGYILYIA